MSQQLRVNFISNLDIDEQSGGWTGINVAIYRQLSSHFATKYVGPINPPTDYPAKLVSKVLRMNGRSGSFHFFSEHRLQRIAKLVKSANDETAHCNFFHGSTPWVLYDSPYPYFLYTDTCFSTYIDVYHDRTRFLTADLKRIRDAEARWLARATRVFFGTHWAMERAVADNAIPRSNLMVAGAGGSMTPPTTDAYSGGLDLLFVALDFERKGGRICVDAFLKVQQQSPEARLSIVGQQPPPEILCLPGVSYEGFLRKSVPAELGKLSTLYSKAFALIHPTSSDIQPLVICEAGYFGCPTIAPGSFGIPELIIDGVTGFLVDIPLKAEEFANRVIGLAGDEQKYRAMRTAVRANAIANQTWAVVGTRIVEEMMSVLTAEQSIKS
ncbi:MAG: glycosyltransferase family 4 protein [Pyrinomonadaceae bacterium]